MESQSFLTTDSVSSVLGSAQVTLLTGPISGTAVTSVAYCFVSELFLVDEDVERLHDFEEECMEELLPGEETRI